MSCIAWRDAREIVVFSGAGMSAESGVPTYRGSGGIWKSYRWQDYACHEAFRQNPEAVLDFHEKRRKAVIECVPHAGHKTLAELEARHPQVTVITQNIDGMHQRAGSRRVVELHGSLWRMRCPRHGVQEDLERAEFAHRRCPRCHEWLRPDITWFGDTLDTGLMERAAQTIKRCDLFVSVGTSGVVWPAAGFPRLAWESGADMVEINLESTPQSHLYHFHLREKASTALISLFCQ